MHGQRTACREVFHEPVCCRPFALAELTRDVHITRGPAVDAGDEGLPLTRRLIHIPTGDLEGNQIAVDMLIVLM